MCFLPRFLLLAVAETVREIGEKENLTSLQLSGNSMGVEAAEAIAGALSSRISLRRALWNDMFVSRLRSEIPPALVSRHSLSGLSLSLLPPTLSPSPLSLYF